MAQQNHEPSNQDLQNQIAANGKVTLDEIYAFRRHMDQKFAPPRAKKTNYAISCNQTGELLFAQYYDIIPCQCFFVFNHSLGKCDVYKVYIKDYHCDREFFALHFKGANKWIVGEIDKLSEKYLYELFLEQEISFNQGLPRAKIQRALYEYFKNLIFSSENICTLPGLPGWYNKQFRHCGNTLKSNALNALPIVRKTFEILPLDVFAFGLYKDFLLQFKDINTRLMISLYPIVSILASVFREFRGKINFSLNLVPTTPLNSFDVSEYFQIFSRNISEVFHSSDSKKMLEKILKEAKDEVLLMDMRLPASADYYRFKQRNDAFEFVSSVLFGRTNIASQRGNSAAAGLVTISDEILLNPNVFNILVSSEFDALSTHGEYIVNLFKENRVMPRIFSQFIRFIEQKDDDFFAAFTRITTAQTRAGSILEIAYELFCDFWHSHNVDFAKELGFSENIDFDALFAPQTEEGDEDIGIFIEKIKGTLGEYYIAPKRGSDTSNECVFYDDALLYFPVHIMESICTSNGIKNHRHILVKLRSKKWLSASQDRLSKQISVNSKTFSCYVLRRELFEKTGDISISHIGKEK